MTFSIVASSPDKSVIGVAVASYFLGIGAYVPAAAADAGGLATQAVGNVALRERGIDMMRQGMAADRMLGEFLRRDVQAGERQVGVVDRHGRAVTYTGQACFPWAGGTSGEGPEGSFAAQGNMLAGAHVVDAMVESWKTSASSETSVPRRLMSALAAGQDAGGDPRGKQSAALFVVSAGAGYGGLSDVLVDLRADNSRNPIGDLRQMLALHEVYFGKADPATLLPWDDALRQKVGRLLKSVIGTTGDVEEDLWAWVSRENFEDRWRKGDPLDPVVLDQLSTHAARTQLRGGGQLGGGLSPTGP